MLGWIIPLSIRFNNRLRVGNLLECHSFQRSKTPYTTDDQHKICSWYAGYRSSKYIYLHTCLPQRIIILHNLLYSGRQI
jgi:hypothetical protein